MTTVLKPAATHSLGISLVHNLPDAAPTVIGTFIYDGVGGPIHHLGVRNFHFEASVFTGMFVHNLYPLQLSDVADDFVPMNVDGLDALRIAMMTVIGLIHPGESVICFARRDQVPYPLGEELDLPMIDDETPKPVGIYRLFTTGIEDVAEPPARPSHLKLVSSQ